MSEKSSETLDVLISGAGPTGMMLAHLLAREGIRFRIIDANPSRVKESRALAIQARSMELFQNLGLVQHFIDRGMPASGVGVKLKGKDPVSFKFSGIGRDDTPYPYLFMLSQSVTEEILENSLLELGVNVERQTIFENFEEQDSKIIAQVKHADGSNETIECKYLIGCDGARSTVRKSADLSFEGGTYDSEFMLADVKLEWNLPYDQLRIFINDDIMAVLFPLKGSKCSRILVIGKETQGTKEAEENLTTKAPVSLEEIKEKFEKATEQKVSISDPLWMTRYRVHHRSVDKMRVKRVFLAGDSAHIHSPVGGQGMNTGLQDAANLAWKLSAVLKGKADDELLDTYNSERLPIAKKLLNFTDRIFSQITSFNPLIMSVAKFLFPIGAKIISLGFVPRIMFGFVSQLNIHYHPNSAITEDLKDSRSHTRIRAGYRAPDATFNDGSTLFELIKGYSFHLLVMTKNSISQEDKIKFETNWKEQNRLGSDAKIHWIDSEISSVAIKRYEVKDTLISLVRPDGYIGFQTDHFPV